MSSISATTTITPVGAPNRRNTELALLLFAVLIPVFAYANVGLAKDGAVPGGMLGYGLGLSLLAGTAHLMVRKLAPYADPLMLPIATLLNGLGLVLIYRLDLEPSVTTHALGGPKAPGQLMWSALAVALFISILVFLKDHRILQRYTYTSGVVALVLLIAPVFFPAINGSKLWIVIPGVGSLQPGEFAKIILAVFFAGYLMVKRDALALASRRFMGLYLPRGRDLGPILAIWALSMMILFLEDDLGSTLLYFGLFVVMLYVATERTSWVVFGLLLASSGAAAVGLTSSHVKVRIHNWLDPFAGIAQHGASEAAQVAWSFGSGGVLGEGLGQGFSWLISGIGVKSDYILATVGEELGLTGMTAVLLLYMLLIERGIRTALAARDPFGKLLAIGLAGAIALQVFVVTGGVTGLIPLTGMTMPFLAQGGSSVVANWALVAILLRISDTARRPPVSHPGPSDWETPHPQRKRFALLRRLNPSPTSSPTPIASSTDAEPTQVVRL